MTGYETYGSDEEKRRRDRETIPDSHATPAVQRMVNQRTAHSFGFARRILRENEPV
jgi:hypothetical protein